MNYEDSEEMELRQWCIEQVIEANPEGFESTGALIVEACKLENYVLTGAQQASGGAVAPISPPQSLPISGG